MSPTGAPGPGAAGPSPGRRPALREQALVLFDGVYAVLAARSTGP